MTVTNPKAPLPSGYPAPPPLAPAPYQTVPDSDLQLRHVFAAVRRGKSTILAVTVVCLVLAIAATLLMHKNYTATATIELNKSSSDQPLGVEDLSGIGDELTVGEQMSSDLLTQLTEITSDTTALMVLDRLKLADVKPFAIPDGEKPDSPLGSERGLPLEKAPRHRSLALKAFSSHLKVEIVKGTRLISVTFKDHDPQQATAIANAVVDVSIDRYTDQRLTASARASSWLKAQLANLKGAVDSSQKKVDDFEKASGLSGLMTQSTARAAGAGGASSSEPGTVTFNNVPLDRLLELNRDLTTAEVIRTEKEAIYKMTQTQDPEVVLGIGSTGLLSAASPGEGNASNRQDLLQLQELRQQQAQDEVRLGSFSSKYGAKNPTVVELQLELTSVKNEIAAELKRIEARSLNDFQLATRTEDGLKQQVAAQQQEVAKTGSTADQLILLQQQAESDRNLYQDLQTKLQEANVVAGIRGSNITVVDVARMSTEPASPKVLLNLGLGLLCGVIFGTILAFGRTYLNDYIYEPEDILSIAPVPIAGLIPDFSDARARSIATWMPWKKRSVARVRATPWVVSSPDSGTAEAFRSLRTELLFGRANNPPRKILFVSGSRGEGKSTTCLNTAAAFAAQGHRVLLIDADMRSLRETRVIGTSSDSGLSTYLADLSSHLGGDAPVDASVKFASGNDSLAFMPAGPKPTDPVRLLGGHRFGELLDKLLAQYDFIFIDSPPALQLTDALVISESVDGIVLVVRANSTTKRGLRSVMEKLRLPNPRLLGVCLNAAEAETVA